MRKFPFGQMAIDQGDVPLFSDFENNGPMWSGQGRREVRHKVWFSERFNQIPSVTVALSMWDMATDANSRVEITSENISEDGFDVVFRTWSDTRIARARASWQAIGTVDDEDNWDV
ncbi:MAG: H-type lectin domain-containing protein [Planktomarina sp.]